MAYIIESLKKWILEHIEKRTFKKWHEEDKMFIFIVILTAIIISVDYALVIKFIEILKVYN